MIGLGRALPRIWPAATIGWSRWRRCVPCSATSAVHLAQPFDMGRAFRLLRQAETTGRPLGSRAWIEQLERQSGRLLAPRKRGPKPRDMMAQQP